MGEAPLLTSGVLASLVLLLVVVPCAAAGQISGSRKEHTQRYVFMLLDAASDIDPSMFSDDMCDNWITVTCNDNGTVSMDTRSLFQAGASLTMTLPEIPKDINASEVMIAYIDASGVTGIQGSLPSTWSKLEHLEYVNLGHAQLCGCVPTSWTDNAVLIAAVSGIPLSLSQGLLASDCAFVNTCMSSQQRISTVSLLQVLADAMPELQSAWTGDNFCEYSGVVCMNDGNISLALEAPASIDGAVALPEVKNADSLMENVPLRFLNITGYGGPLPASWVAIVERALFTDLTGNTFCECLTEEWKTSTAAMQAVDALGAAGAALTDANCASRNSCLPPETKNATVAFLELLASTIPSIGSQLDRFGSALYCSWTGIACSRRTGSITANFTEVPTDNGHLPDVPAHLSERAVAITSLSIAGLRGTLPPSWASVSGIGTLAFPNAAFCHCMPAEWATNTALTAAVKSLGELGSKLTSTNCLSVLSCLSAQQKASTVAFLRSLGAGLTALQSTWAREEESYCNWPGVSCGAQGHVSVRVGAATGALTPPPADVDCASVMVREINISHGDLSGTLPERWYQLPILEVVDLTNTSVGGSLPRMWNGGMRWLKKLRLALTNIEGDLPLWTLPNITTIHLNDAKLHGTLDASWAAFPRLTELNITGNRFCACMPVSWAAFPVLHQAVAAMGPPLSSALTSSTCATSNQCDIASSSSSSGSSPTTIPEPPGPPNGGGRERPTLRTLAGTVSVALALLALASA